MAGKALKNELKDLEAQAAAAEAEIASLWAGLGAKAPSGARLAAGAGLGAALGAGVRGNPVWGALAGLGLAYLSAPNRGPLEARAPETPLGEAAAEAREAWRGLADAAYASAEDKLATLAEVSAQKGAEALDLAREKAHIAEALARDLAASFRHDLEGLTEETAERVAQARAEAYRRAREIGARAAEGMGAGLDLIRRHPYATAAAGVAAGTAIWAVRSPKARAQIAQIAPNLARLAPYAALAESLLSARAATAAQGPAEAMARQAGAEARAARESAGEGLRETGAELRARLADEIESLSRAAQERLRGNGLAH